jgi:hypothetical protein
MRGKDKAGGGLRDDAGLAPKLGRTVAFALEDEGNGTIISARPKVFWYNTSLYNFKTYDM